MPKFQNRTQTRVSRRLFLGASAGTAAALSISNARPVWSNAPSNTVRVALIGAGGRGNELARVTNTCDNAKIVAVVDPDISRAEQRAEAHGGDAYTDLRKALERDDIDAVVIATCNHWHVLAAMWSLQAGKHVYVEKPLSHTQQEGRLLVDAAAKSGLIVQIGTQQRSDPMQAEAKKLLHEDKLLGEIKYVQANRLGPRTSIGKRMAPLDPPKSVDYDLWLGPAADRPIMRDRLHYDWHWDWNTGSGEMGNWGVHILDDIRNVVYLDSVKTPSKVYAAGGRLGWNDAGNTPNVHYAFFETEKFPTLIALSNLPLKSSSNGKGGWKCPVDGAVNGPASGYVVACENGYYLGQRQHGKAIDLNGKTIKQFRGGDIVPLHLQNFVDTILANDATKLNGSVEQGHHSTGWCNLANVAVRTGAKLKEFPTDLTESVQQFPAIVKAMSTQLAEYNATIPDLSSSPILRHDPESEKFVGEHAETANSFLSRVNRTGYEFG